MKTALRQHIRMNQKYANNQTRYEMSKYLWKSAYSHFRLWNKKADLFNVERLFWYRYGYKLGSLLFIAAFNVYDISHKF